MTTMIKVALFFCFFFTLTFSSSSKTVTTGNKHWWCTQTPHYQTCNHYVAKNNISSTATISINQFLDMNVQAVIDEAHMAKTRAQGIYVNYPDSPGKSLWGSCVDYFDGIAFTLNLILDHTNQSPPDPLDVHTWLSAGVSYINVCEKGFEMINLKNTMLPSITANMTQLLLNSLAIAVVIRGGNYSHNPHVLLDEWESRDEFKVPNITNIKPDVVVAQDGSGDFRSVQEAVNSGAGRAWGSRYVIYVKAGVYEEKVVISKDDNFILMYGDGVNKTIITAADHSGGNAMTTAKAGDLKSSATFQVWGRRFMALHMTFRNTAGPENGQAVAFLSASHKSIVYGCSIEGYQDTLFSYNSIQFYKNCQISGTVDFIFGDGFTLFQDCDIILKRPLPGGGLVVTANGRKYQNESSGYSLQGCKILIGDDLKPVLDQYKKAFLGRPWMPFARTVFMESFLDEFVDPLGWEDSWGNKDTAYCGEYNNYGPGSSTDQRVNWPDYHAITDPNIAKQFTADEFIGGKEWIPFSGVPYVPGFERS